jgi:hypothetical protein
MVYMPDGIVVVFVGCGGTYWTSANYFCSLLKRLQPSAIHYVDPDRLTERNTDRQWCQGDHAEDGVSKVGAASYDFTPRELGARTFSSPLTFQQWADKWTDAGAVALHKDVLVIVNVDNDDARLAIRKWCMGRDGRTLMVMSGCDMNYGQVYFGVYEKLGAVHDWKPFHLDVGDPDHQPIDGGEPRGCGAQSTLSNYMTGALFAPAILEAMKFWRPDTTLPDQVGEYYWRRDERHDTIRAYTAKVVRTGVDPTEIF